MARPPRHADLVARALDVLPDAERRVVDRAIEADPSLREHYEAIAGHLLRYDHLPPAPPPPPFAHLAEALDREAAPDLRILRLAGRGARPRRGLAWAAAALVALGVALWAPWTSRRPSGELQLVQGLGLRVARDGVTLPARAPTVRAVRPGDVLTCERPAEARLGPRVHLVLDGGGTLRVDGGEAVTLLSGRAFFEVAPGAFRVDTPYGRVRVLGTAFDVDLREGSLAVAVAHGRVDAAGTEVGPGASWRKGRLAPLQDAPGSWFRRPQLDLELVDPTGVVLGRPLALVLAFHNPGNLPLTLDGPGTSRTPVWVRFETADGALLGELPVLSANVTKGLELLEPGGAVTLAPGARAELAVRILPPIGSPGAYRCEALYRPQDQPAVLSSSLAIEVR